MGVVVCRTHDIHVGEASIRIAYRVCLDEQAGFESAEWGIAVAVDITHAQLRLTTRTIYIRAKLGSSGGASSRLEDSLGGAPCRASTPTRAQHPAYIGDHCWGRGLVDEVGRHSRLAGAVQAQHTLGWGGGGRSGGSRRGGLGGGG